MYITDEAVMRQYVIEMELIKKMNKEYMEIKDSTEYNIGRECSILKKCLKKGNFRQLLNMVQKKLKVSKSLCSYEKVEIEKSCVKENYFSSERIAIYTCITGGYDSVIEPLFIPDNCDYYLVTDREKKLPANSAWKQIVIDRSLPQLQNLDNAGLNRYYKMHPDVLFEDYNYSIYIDGNIKVIGDLTAYINLISKAGIAVHRHGKRDCVYEEAKTIVALGKAKRSSIENHMQKLEQMNFPKHYGLLECNIIARQHNLEMCKSIMNMWWNDYITLSKRDQMSLPSVLYRLHMRVEDIATLGTGVENDYLVRVESHR